MDPASTCNGEPLLALIVSFNQARTRTLLLRLAETRGLSILLGACGLPYSPVGDHGGSHLIQWPSWSLSTGSWLLQDLNI